MTRDRRRIHLAGLLVTVAALTWLLVPDAVAYIGQNPYDVHLDGPSGTVPCSRDVVIKATVRSATNGDPVGHQIVKWDLKQSPSSGDRLSSSSTTTGSDGTTSVTLSFGPVAGSRDVRATVATYPATLTVKCEGAGPAPTPRPTPKPTQRPAPPPTSRPGPVTPTARPTAMPPTNTEAIPAGPVTPTGPDLRIILVLVFLGTGLGVLIRRPSR